MSPTSELYWVESEGGPLIILPEDLLGFWDGVREPPVFRNVDARFRWSAETGPTDYDRACDVDDYLGLIDVGPGQGIVLGDAPLRTTWVSNQDLTGGWLVRWVQALDDGEIRRALDSDLRRLQWMDNLEIALEAAPLVLFDSGIPGDEIGAAGLHFRLPKGRYKLSTARYSNEGDTELLLHAFRRFG